MPDPKRVGDMPLTTQGAQNWRLSVCRSIGVNRNIWDSLKYWLPSKERETKDTYHKHSDTSSITVLVISLVFKSWAISLAWPFISIGFMFDNIWVLFTKRLRGLINGWQWPQLFPPLVQMDATYPSSSENYAGVLITYSSFLAHIFTCFCQDVKTRMLDDIFDKRHLLIWIHSILVTSVILLILIYQLSHCEIWSNSS